MPSLYAVMSEEKSRQSERIKKLQEENKQLKKQREELFIRERDTKNEWRELKQENEKLKSFIDDLTTEGTGRIDLANGYSYRVNVVLTDLKR